MLCNLFAPIAKLLYPRLFIALPHQHAKNYQETIPPNLAYRVLRKTVYANLSGQYQVQTDEQYLSALDALSFVLPAANSVPQGWQTVLTKATNDLTVGVVASGDDTILGLVGTVSLASPSAMAVFVSDGVDNWETSIAPTVG